MPKPVRVACFMFGMFALYRSLFVFVIYAKLLHTVKVDKVLIVNLHAPVFSLIGRLQ